MVHHPQFTTNGWHKPSTYGCFILQTTGYNWMLILSSPFHIFIQATKIQAHLRGRIGRKVVAQKKKAPRLQMWKAWWLSKDVRLRFSETWIQVYDRSRWAISETQGSRKGHQQIWEGPIAYHTFVHERWMANLGGIAYRKMMYVHRYDNLQSG